jgi:hypothetical protein
MEWTFYIAQSTCTHYSCFENMGRFVPLKKIRSKIWTWKKQGAKKQGHCYSKREKDRLHLLFLNNNGPVFLHSAFFRTMFWNWFLKVPDWATIYPLSRNPVWTFYWLHPPLLVHVAIEWPPTTCVTCQSAVHFYYYTAHGFPAQAIIVCSQRAEVRC